MARTDIPVDVFKRLNQGLATRFLKLYTHDKSSWAYYDEAGAPTSDSSFPVALPYVVSWLQESIGSDVENTIGGICVPVYTAKISLLNSVVNGYFFKWMLSKSPVGMRAEKIIVDRGVQYIDYSLVVDSISAFSLDNPSIELLLVADLGVGDSYVGEVDSSTKVRKGIGVGTRSSAVGEFKPEQSGPTAVLSASSLAGESTLVTDIDLVAAGFPAVGFGVVDFETFSWSEISGSGNKNFTLSSPLGFGHKVGQRITLPGSMYVFDFGPGPARISSPPKLEVDGVLIDAQGAYAVDSMGSRILLKYSGTFPYWRKNEDSDYTITRSLEFTDFVLQEAQSYPTPLIPGIISQQGAHGAAFAYPGYNGTVAEYVTRATGYDITLPVGATFISGESRVKVDLSRVNNSGYITGARTANYSIYSFNRQYGAPKLRTNGSWIEGNHQSLASLGSGWKLIVESDDFYCPNVNTDETYISHLVSFSLVGISPFGSDPRDLFQIRVVIKRNGSSVYDQVMPYSALAISHDVQCSSPSDLVRVYVYSSALWSGLYPNITWTQLFFVNSVQSTVSYRKGTIFSYVGASFWDSNKGKSGSSVGSSSSFSIDYTNPVTSMNGFDDDIYLSFGYVGDGEHGASGMVADFTGTKLSLTYRASSAYSPYRMTEGYELSVDTSGFVRSGTPPVVLSDILGITSPGSIVNADDVASASLEYSYLFSGYVPGDTRLVDCIKNVIMQSALLVHSGAVSVRMKVNNDPSSEAPSVSINDDKLVSMSIYSQSVSGVKNSVTLFRSNQIEPFEASVYNSGRSEWSILKYGENAYQDTSCSLIATSVDVDWLIEKLLSINQKPAVIIDCVCSGDPLFNLVEIYDTAVVNSSFMNLNIKGRIVSVYKKPVTDSIETFRLVIAARFYSAGVDSAEYDIKIDEKLTFVGERVV